MQYETSVGSPILHRTAREYSHYSFKCWNEYFENISPLKNSVIEQAWGRQSLRGLRGKFPTVRSTVETNIFENISRLKNSVLELVLGRQSKRGLRGKIPIIKSTVETNIFENIFPLRNSFIELVLGKQS